MTRQLVELVALLVLAGGFGLVVLLVALRPAVGAWLGCGGLVITLALRQPLLPDSLTLAGISIQPLDVVAVVLGSAGALRLSRRSFHARLHLPIVLLLMLLVIHVARGVSTFGFQVAVNGARSWIWFVSALMFGATVMWSPSLERAVVWSSLLLSAFAFWGLAHSGLHSTTQLVVVNGEAVDPRPVTAAGALVILQGLIIFTHGSRIPVLRTPWVALIPAAAAILLEHRTIWVAGFFAGIVIHRAWSRRTLRRDPRRAYFVTGILILVLPLVLAGVAGSASLAGSISETTAQHSTFQWRVASWSSLIREHHSPEDLVFGLPAGSSWERPLFGGQALASPHSYYVEALMRFGAPGLLLFLTLFMLSIRRAQRYRGGDQMRVIFITVLLTQVVFAFTNQLSIVQGLALGALLARLVQDSAAERREVRLPSQAAAGVA